MGGVDAARHDPHVVGGHAHAAQLAHLVGARGDDHVGLGRHPVLQRQALGGAGVGLALVASLDAAQRVEGLGHRHPPPAGRAQGGQARHPEVRVHHLGIAGAGPVLCHPVGEVVHVRQQLVLGQALRRAGRNVHHRDAGAGRHPFGQVGVVAPGVDVDLVAQPGQTEGQFGHVHVLPPSVRLAEGGERAGVFGHHCDLHGDTSLRMRSQSRRNLEREKRSSAWARATRPRARASSGSASRWRAVARSRTRSLVTRPASGGHRLGRLGRRQGEHRHPEQHRLDQRQAQAGPAVGVQVDAVLREGVVQLGLRQVVAPAAVEPGQALLLGHRAELVAGHAVDVHRQAAGHAEHDVAAGDPPPAHRLVDADGQRRVLARVPRAGVGDAVLDHRRRVVAAVPGHRVEGGDVRDEHVAKPRVAQHRVLAAHGVLGGCVVLEVDDRQVGADATAGPPLDEVDLVGALQHDDVDLLVAELVGRHLPGAAGPVPRAGAAAAVGAAVGQHRQEVVVRPLEEGVEVGAVHVPDEHLHDAPPAARVWVSCAATGDPARARTAATTSAAGTSVHGWPGTGQRRARVRAQPASWSPSTTRGHPPRTPPLERHDRGEQADDRGAHRGREVCRTGVADHHGGGAGEHAGQLTQRGAAGQVDPTGRGDGPAHGPVVGATGDHDPPALGGEGVGVVPRPLGADAASGDRRGRVHDDVAAAEPGGRAGVGHRKPVVAGARVPGRGHERLHRLHLVASAEPRVVTVRHPAVTHVEQRTREVVARGHHGRHAGPPGEQRHRQGALVVGGEHDDLVVVRRAHPGEQLVEQLRVVRLDVCAHPGHVGDEHLVDAGEQCGSGGPTGRDEQVQHVDVGPELSQRGPGEQHVALAVEAHGERLAPTPPVSHGATRARCRRRRRGRWRPPAQPRPPRRGSSGWAPAPSAPPLRGPPRRRRRCRR